MQTQTPPLQCVVVGDATLTVRCCEVLLEHGWQICGVVSSNLKLITLAEEQSIKVFASLSDVAMHFKDIA